MDASRVNYLLGRAIAGFQEDEIEELSRVATGDFAEDIDVLFEERKTRRQREAPRVPICCLDCGEDFVRKIGKRTFEARCPRCGGYDTEPRV
jgi:hypothetical protein